MSSSTPGARPPTFKFLMPVDNTFVDHYAILDVSHTATREETEKSFRRKLLACQRGEVPDDAQAVVPTQAHLSRLEHAHDVLLDADQQTEFGRRLALKMTQLPGKIEKVESYELESPFDIFGTTIKALLAQPPPKGKMEMSATAGTNMGFLDEDGNRIAECAGRRGKGWDGDIFWVF